MNSLVSSPHPSSSSSSCVTTSKPGSVLGLKSCHLNGPSIAHPDLHSTSSRRLMQAITSDPPNTTTKPRSAGSFRLDESFSWLSKEDLAFEEKPMPVPLPAIDATAIPKATNYVHLEGDISSADVDLLPMPGLVSLASPLYESYLSVSPTDSRMTSISSSDTANSCKSAKMMPNYLGLPPSFFQEVDGNLAKCCGPANFRTVVEKPPVSSEEEDLGCPRVTRTDCLSIIGEVLPEFDDIAVGNSSITSYPVVHVEEDDNFAESQSLAGLWSDHDVINCDPYSMLHGSEGLDSILTDLPHNYHEVMTAESDMENCIGSGFIVDELEYLMIPSKAEASCVGSDVTHNIANGFRPVAVSAASEPLREASFGAGHSKEKVWKSGLNTATAVMTSSYPHFEGKEGSLPFASQHENSQESSIMVPRMPSLSSEASFNAGSYELNANGNMHSLPMPMKVEPHCITGGLGSMIGKKRPFSVIELPCIVSTSKGVVNAINSNVLASQSDSVTIMRQEKQESKNQEMSYSSATQAFSAMLYKAQGGGHSRLNWAVNHDVNEVIKAPPSKARRRHGTAMDPQSVAARTRREKFSDRIRMLQSLVPNGDRLDTVSMLGQTLEYVRFLQHQVWQLYHGMDPSSNIKCEKWKDFLEPGQPAST